MELVDVDTGRGTLGKKNDERDVEQDEPKGGRPGPADHGREGGMATREQAPELTEPRDGD